MSRVLYIVGTGGFAKEVAHLANAINATAPRRWRTIEYLAHTDAEIGKPMPYGEIVGTDKLLALSNAPVDVAIGIGSPAARARIAAHIALLPHATAPNLVHPRAGLEHSHVKLGIGNLVTHGAVFTCDIAVGDYNVFNLNSTVGHDVRIGSFNVINPGCNVSGGVQIGDGCLLGTGCQILENLQVASHVVIGGGAVVARSIEAAGIYVGIPAKALK